MKLPVALRCVAGAFRAGFALSCAVIGLRVLAAESPRVVQSLDEAWWKSKWALLFQLNNVFQSGSIVHDLPGSRAGSLTSTVVDHRVLR